MEVEIQELLARSAEAWRRRDAGALADLMHPNANYPLGTGEAVVGRPAIEARLEPLCAMVPRDVETESESLRIHLVTPDLAIVDSVARNVRVGAGGERETLSTEAFTIVAVREEGEWLVAAIRGALPPRA